MSHSSSDFEALVARHQAAVCAVAYSVLRDRARSEEIAQEAFLVAWQKLPGIRPAPSMPGWVCGIARNLARNAARRRTEAVMTDTLRDSIANDDSPLVALLDRETIELADRALALLSDVEREAVVLYYRGEQSMTEVASALGISQAAAKKRVFRGRDNLRAALHSVEARLLATRPGRAFTAACVAALLARGGTSSAAATTPAKLGTSAKLAVLAAAVAIPATAYGVLHRDTIAPLEVAATTPRATTWTSLTRTIDGADRDALRAQLQRGREARLAITTGGGGAGPATAPSVKVYDFSGEDLFGGPPASTEPRAPGPLTKVDMRRAIRDVIPFMRECYTAAAPQLATKTGVLPLVVRVETEPDVGTLVTDARLDGDSPFAANAELVECVRASLLAIELPPLADAGVIDIHYPLTIRPLR